MFSKLSLTALLGSSLLSVLVTAYPANLNDNLVASAAPTNTFSSASSSATPFSLSDGFPNPNAAQLQKIELLAHGTLPNGPPPADISSDGLTNLMLINFNENFEVAFFSSLVNNITNKVPGFAINDKATHDYVLDTLIAVVAQEELHATNAANALAHFGHEPILPCKYVFPTTNLADAFDLAATFTDVVLGTLQDVIEVFADNNDNGLTRGIASVIGQEGEQEGFFRLMQNNAKIPNALPFLTTSTRDFAFTALQGFVVPGSCPNENLIRLRVFGTLNLLTENIQAKDQTLNFNVDVQSLAKTSANSAGWTSDARAARSAMGTSQADYSKLSIVYINQQNVPVAVPIQDFTVNGSTGIATFCANFPYTDNEMNGLTIVALAVGNKFDSAAAVDQATLFGPALIEIN